MRFILLPLLLLLPSCAFLGGATHDGLGIPEADRVYIYYMPFSFETYTPIPKELIATIHSRSGVVSRTNGNYTRLMRILESAPSTQESAFNIRLGIKYAAGEIFLGKDGVVEGASPENRKLSGDAIRKIESILYWITFER